VSKLPYPLALGVLAAPGREERLRKLGA